MILEEEAYKKFGYHSKYLKPQSHKQILAVCDECGTIRITSKNRYHSLCQSCAKKGKRNHFYGKHHTEETKKRMRENHRDIHGIHNSNFGKVRSETHKQRLSESKKGKCCGKQNPNWQGGKSFEPYCILFNNEFKERVREYFNRCCYICGKNEVENGQRLDVHHVTYNKDTCCDDSLPLFVPLCRNCHAKTHHNRQSWEKFFVVSLDYLTNGKCYVSKNK